MTIAAALSGACSKVRFLSFLIILIFLLTSCRQTGGGQTDSSSSSAGTAAPQTDEEAAAASQTQDAAAQDPSSSDFLSPVPGYPGLTDLSEAAHKVDGKLCAYALTDEDHLLLLSLRDNTYEAYSMDIADGALTSVLTFPCADEAASMGEYMELLSADPVIVWDSASGLLYRPQASDPDARQYFLPAWLSDAAPLVLDGQIYLSGMRGIVYALREDNTLESVWRLPRQFSRLEPFPVRSTGLLSFVTYPAWNDRITCYVALDPVTGESTFYETDLSPSYYAAGGEGLLVSTAYRQTPCISLRSPEHGWQRILTLPDQAQAILSQPDRMQEDIRDRTAPAEDDHIALDTAPLCLSGRRCCWMLSDSSGCPVKLYLWDYEKTPVTDYEAPVIAPCEIPGEITYGKLTERAQALEKTYGISIVMGDNVPEYFDDYRVEAMTDERIMDGMLSVLENTLALYPEGFFDALKGDYYRDVVIYLTGAMSPHDQGINISNAGAFTTETFGLCNVAFNLEEDPAMCTVIHELVHAADYRLAGQMLLDEEAWNAMNPEGFSYYEAYIDENGESYEWSGSTQYTIAGGGPPDQIWFIDPYSKTFPMEDRARLVEYLMGRDDPPDNCFSGAPIQQKLTFYFRILRQVLDDGTWGEETSWERALREMK